MILSSRYLGAPGSTTLMAMLINIRPKPSASLARRGRTRSISKGLTLRNVSAAFFLGFAGDTVLRVAVTGRSALNLGTWRASVEPSRATPPDGEFAALRSRPPARSLCRPRNAWDRGQQVSVGRRFEALHALRAHDG